VHNTVNLYQYKHNLEEKLAEQRKKLEEQAERLHLANQYVIDALTTTVEFRSIESGAHIKRIRDA
jgi:putative two-component system response regulator